MNKDKENNEDIRFYEAKNKDVDIYTHIVNNKRDCR